MRACSGTWIAHGSGSADRETVDRKDRVAVPPEHPLYQMRRIWLSKEEEDGYYYGFANEGLWPLCHIAHVRPTFRASDWEQYRRVNRKFADAVVAEAKSRRPHRARAGLPLRAAAADDPRAPPRRDDPHVLAHPVAEPRGVRHLPVARRSCSTACSAAASSASTRSSTATTSSTPSIGCSRRASTARRSRSRFRGESTAVHRYPISIEWPPAPLANVKPVAGGARAPCASAWGCRPTTGSASASTASTTRRASSSGSTPWRACSSRSRAGSARFTFVQIAAPSRATIDDYRDYAARVQRAGRARSTTSYARAKYPPIVLIAEHHEPEAVYEYHRAADLCFVSSLHDGMNLVAKEFVAARDDEQGVLILSQFAGASRELPEALVVNPYDAEQCAQALNVALTMPEAEQRDRMRIMRGVVREFNVYRWAGRMLLDAAVMRQRGRYPRGRAWSWAMAEARAAAAGAPAPAARAPGRLHSSMPGRVVPRHRRHAARPGPHAVAAFASTDVVAARCLRSRASSTARSR